MVYNNQLETALKYFKNTELAKLHNISEKSVRNWIQSSIDGKLDLQLYEANGKSFVANTTKNTATIDDLVLKGKKFKNTRGYKLIKPTTEFYKLYTPKQILDIISNIDVYREVPLQYSYFNGGAQRWDQYTQQLQASKTQNSLTNTLRLIEANLDYIDMQLEDFTQVNIIDIGVGNGMPVKDLISHFKAKNMLKRYVALDISQELLHIAQKNFKKWFKDEVKFEGYVRDINHERFDDLLVGESFGEGAGKVVNLVLFLGGTISNFRQPNHPLITIHDSMGRNDLLIFTKKLDSENSRRYFDFTGSSSLAIDLVLNLLNISKEYYDLEQFFDEKTMQRQVRAKLNVAISIQFELEGKSRIVELHKGDGILLLRVRHQNAMDTLNQFDENGLDLLHASRSKDQEYLLLMSKIKSSYETEK